MAIFLATAERKTTRGKSGGVPRRPDAPPRIVIHTTETNQLPGYQGGRSAPHFTLGVGDPGSLTAEPLGVVRLWQHISLDRSAYALRHPRATPETNHMGAHCIQIECVTYVGDQPDHGIVGNRGQFPPALTRALAGLVREITAAVAGIDIGTYPDLWSANGAASANSPQRLSDHEWTSFNGICGHQHVPHNSHWDPGAFDIAELVRQIRGESAGTGAVAPEHTPAPVPAPTADWPFLLEIGVSDDRVQIARGLLQTLGYGDFSASDLYNQKVVDAVKKLQRAERIQVDGIWGPETHSSVRARLSAELAR